VSPPSRTPGSTTATASGRYELLDHTADLRLRLYAPTAEALYSTAVEALAAILLEDAPQAKQRPRKSVEISLHGTDPADLLIQLLNEALYYIERTGRIPTGLEAVKTTATNLEALLNMAGLEAVETTATNLDVFLREIKAATYSELRWETDESGGLIAELTLDL